MCLSQCLSGYKVSTHYPVWSFLDDVWKTPNTLLDGGRELCQSKLTFPHFHKLLHVKAVVIWQLFKWFVLDVEWNQYSTTSVLQDYLIDRFRVWSQKFLGLQDHLLQDQSFIPLQLCHIHGSLVLPESLSYHFVWHHKRLPQ